MPNRRTTSQLVWQPRAAQRQDLLQDIIKEHNLNRRHEEVQDQIREIGMERIEIAALALLPLRSHRIIPALARFLKPVLPSASKSTCIQTVVTSPSDASTRMKQQQNVRHENAEIRNSVVTLVSALASNMMTVAGIEDMEEADTFALLASNP